MEGGAHCHWSPLLSICGHQSNPLPCKTAISSQAILSLTVPGCGPCPTDNSPLRLLVICCVSHADCSTYQSMVKSGASGIQNGFCLDLPSSKSAITYAVQCMDHACMFCKVWSVLTYLGHQTSSRQPSQVGQLRHPQASCC